MEQMSVTQFAGELKMPAAVLLEQLKRAGVEKSGLTELLTEQDKARLLEYLRRSHGDSQPKGKITRTRKQTSEIRATDSTGRARTVQVEVRKKRTFVKRDDVAEPVVAAEDALDVQSTTADASAVIETVSEAAPAVEAPVMEAPVVEAPVAETPPVDVAAVMAEVPAVVEAATVEAAKAEAAKMESAPASSAAAAEAVPTARPATAAAPTVTTVLSKPRPLSEILSEDEIAARKRDEGGETGRDTKRRGATRRSAPRGCCSN